MHSLFIIWLHLFQFFTCKVCVDVSFSIFQVITCIKFVFICICCHFCCIALDIFRAYVDFLFVSSVSNCQGTVAQMRKGHSKSPGCRIESATAED